MTTNQIKWLKMCFKTHVEQHNRKIRDKTLSMDLLKLAMRSKEKKMSCFSLAWSKLSRIGYKSTKFSKIINKVYKLSKMYNRNTYVHFQKWSTREPLNYNQLLKSLIIKKAWLAYSIVWVLYIFALCLSVLGCPVYGSNCIRSAIFMVLNKISFNVQKKMTCKGRDRLYPNSGLCRVTMTCKRICHKVCLTENVFKRNNGITLS